MRNQKHGEVKQQSNNEQSLRTIVDNNLFMLRYAWRHSPYYVFLTCFLIVYHTIVIYIEHTLGIKLITDAIQYGEPFSKVIAYIILICLLVALALIMNSYCSTHIEPKGLEKLYKSIRAELYEKASHIDLACYDNPDYYNEFILSLNEVQTRVKNTIEYVKKLLANVTLLFIVGGFFLFMDKVGLIFVTVSIVSALTVTLSLNKLKFLMRLEMNVKERQRGYVKRVFYLADYAKEMRLNPVTDKLYKDFRKSNEEMRQIVHKYGTRLLILNFIRNFVCNSFILDGLYMLYIAFMTLVKHAFSYGSAVALVNSAWRLNSSLQGLNQLAGEFQENSMYIGKIRAFMAYEQQVTDKEDAVAVPEQPVLIELKHVSFAYSPEADNNLNNISLTIRPYEKIALVGYNGAGKTTLMKLLMRLYDVTDGEIRLNGKDIRDYKLTDYRRSFGTVFQDYQLFAATLAENVMMDEVPDHRKDERMIVSSLESSGFKERLNSMELGIQTPLTREFDTGGTSLSGGEAQKIAIARVFAKNSPYIILDEPSSALDPISEYHLNQSMFEAAKNKTVIFIAHRLSTTRMADRIYMLEKGEIVEQGTHEELMKLGGKYAEMFNLQSEKYKVVSGDYYRR